MKMICGKDDLNLPDVKIYDPYKPGISPVAMNLQVLDLAAWIEVDRRLPLELAEKRRLLAERKADVFAALPEADPGSQETLDLLIQHLLTHYPQVYQKQDQVLFNRATGERWSTSQSDLQPLELAGRLVQEDLCLMTSDQGQDVYRLTAACLCFPTRWRLLEKLGQSLGDIHDPVPKYASDLASPMDRLFARLKINRPLWRVNWSIVDDPALFQPTGYGKTESRPDITVDNIADQLWIRMERQTLRRLPRSNDILFTIRIYVQPLFNLTTRPDQAARLASTLRGLDEDIQIYKSVLPFKETMLAWLDKIVKPKVG